MPTWKTPLPAIPLAARTATWLERQNHRSWASSNLTTANRGTGFCCAPRKSPRPARTRALLSVRNMDNPVKQAGFCKPSPQKENIILVVVRDQNDFRIAHVVANSLASAVRFGVIPQPGHPRRFQHSYARRQL